CRSSITAWKGQAMIQAQRWAAAFLLGAALAGCEAGTPAKGGGASLGAGGNNGAQEGGAAIVADQPQRREEQPAPMPAGERGSSGNTSSGCASDATSATRC